MTLSNEWTSKNTFDRLGDLLAALLALNNNIGQINVNLAQLITTLSQISLNTPQVLYITTSIAVSAVNIANEATIWSPASGKKFRLMGGVLALTGAAVNTTLKDGAGGPTILTLPTLSLNGVVAFDLGQGILSAAVNNPLRAVGTALSVLNGAVWGKEE